MDMINRRDRFDEIRSILIFALILTWGLAVPKLLYGWLTGSASMVADGFHSFSDGFSNILGLIGISIASRPVDETHPYGYKKVETLTSFGIAGLLFLISLDVIWEGIHRFLHPVVPDVTPGSFLIMGVTLAINIGLMIYEAKMGKILRSDILIYSALHTRADILTSSCVIFTLIGIKVGYPILDPSGSLVIAFFIGHAGFGALRKSSRILSDATAIPSGEIEKVVLSIEGVKGCHQIRSRGRPDDICIDLHVLVDPKMPMDQAHQLSKMIENEIKRCFEGVTDVVVHMGPFGIHEESRKRQRRC
jgi:cation diffusion facilitator family transporter